MIYGARHHLNVRTYAKAKSQYIKILVQQLNFPHPRPSPKGRGETRDSLALWERAGVRVTNLEILSIADY